MKFRRYTDVDEYKADVLDILLEDEVRNNIAVGILVDGKRENVSEWLMATVVDDFDKIVLIALCTMPFRLLICEPAGIRHDGSVEFLANELRRIRFAPPGVLAISSLAERFAEAYCNGVDEEDTDGAGDAGGAYSAGGAITARHHMTMILMRLDNLAEYTKAPGFCRMLNEKDLSYTPAWENAFCVDCRVPVYTLSESENRIKTRLGMNIHYIWEDGQPVSQAVFGRNTPNGAAISWVYTPPEFRGRGYATSVVAELSKAILDGGKSFCCLFADAANPASCSIYRKLGYYDVCLFDEIKFDTTV